MAARMSAGIRVLTLLLIGAVVSSVALATKPEKPLPEPEDPPVTYEVVWLGSSGGYTIASGVNKSGIVVGYSKDANGDSHAFVYPDPATGELAALVVSPQSSANCINNAGRIAGQLVDGSGNPGIFVCNADGSDLQILPLVAARLSATDISEDGVVAGWFEDLTGHRQGFVWMPGELPIIISNLWDLTGINDGLQIVGTIPRDDKFQGEIFRWTLPEFVTQSVTADPEILADATHTGFGRIDINHTGVIAGTISSKGYWRPARYTDGTGWELVHANNKQWGFSEAINAEGHICGRLVGEKMGDRDTGFVFFGVVGHSLDGFWPLDDLVDRTDPWWKLGDWDDDTVALGMSDVDESGYGMIVGYKALGADVSPNGKITRLGFVLIPVPPSQP